MRSTETKRYLKGKQTKQKIFDVAKALILSKGYQQVTVDEICAACALSKGAFYIHYSSKEEIVKQLYREDIQEFIQEKFDQFVKGHPEANALDKLKAFVRIALSFAPFAGVELTRLAHIINLSSTSDDASYLADCLKPQWLYDIVDEGAGKSLLRAELTKEETVNYLYTYITGALVAWCQSGDSYDIVQMEHKSVDMLIRGLQ